MWNGLSMGTRTTLRLISGLFLLLGFVTGCANEFVLFHSASGSPILISHRAYTSDGCTKKVKEDAVRLGVTFQYVHIRGNFAGRSLLWPFEPGYACEAAIGPEHFPTGAYTNGRDVILKGS
jgi:hypothetical protein